MRGVKKTAAPRQAATPTKSANPGRKSARTVAKVAKPGAKSPPSPAGRPGPRKDLGAPIDSFFAKRSGPLGEILDQLRASVQTEVPGAASSIKWGMPFYTLGGKPVCALASFKAHVNLILAGPDGTFADPDGLLEGDGKTGRHLKLRAGNAIPTAAVRGWLRAAVANARGSE